jgi:hypothetical protein
VLRVKGETMTCTSPEHASEIDEHGCCDACGTFANQAVLKVGSRVRVIGENLTELPKWVVSVDGEVATLSYSKVLRAFDFSEYVRNLYEV